MDLTSEDFGDDSDDSTTEDDAKWQLDEGQQVEYQLDDDEVAYGQEWGTKRNESYSSGDDRRNDWGDNGGLASMQRGTIVELVLALLYEECDFDTEISASGDGGIDGSLDVDGTESSFDVKASTADDNEVPFDVELLVAKHTFDRENTPDIFISAYVSDDMSTVRLRGWKETSDLRETELKDAYSGDHENYAVPIEDLEEMPIPTDLSHSGTTIVNR